MATMTVPTSRYMLLVDTLTLASLTTEIEGKHIESQTFGLAAGAILTLLHDLGEYTVPEGFEVPGLTTA